jgi:hypothetical protein
MDAYLVTPELRREFAAMIMILAPAALITRKALERFAWFCFGFGVWDLFYYFWLKVLLDWPSDLATMDLLFLIPIPGVGPVWAPSVVSVGLIVLALLILYKRSKDPQWRLGGTWALLIAAALVIIFSFMLDPIQQGVHVNAFSPEMITHMETYFPLAFPWPWFLLGAVLGLAGTINAARSR